MPKERKFLKQLNMKVTLTYEDDNQDIEFLDCLFHRKQDQSDTLKNSVVELSCQNCNFSHFSTTKNTDVQRTVQNMLSEKHHHATNT